MSNEEIYRVLIGKLKEEHAFWSYDSSDIGAVSDETLIAKVLLHLDIEEVLLFNIKNPDRYIRDHRNWRYKSFKDISSCKTVAIS